MFDLRGGEVGARECESALPDDVRREIFHPRLPKKRGAEAPLSHSDVLHHFLETGSDPICQEKGSDPDYDAGVAAGAASAAGGSSWNGSIVWIVPSSLYVNSTGCLMLRRCVSPFETWLS